MCDCGGEFVQAQAMADVRHDPMTGRWVAIAAARATRPGASSPAADSSDACPFCAGHEDQTPPETLRLGDGPTGWDVRVVPNLYPALERQEVVIHGSTHAHSLAELSDATLELVAEAWQRRARDAGGRCFPSSTKAATRARHFPIRTPSWRGCRRLRPR